jgi:phenylalanyl-tRNA synthetase beta chain
VKTTYRWLQEFTALDVPPATLAEQLTLTGLEVESITPVAPPFSNVVVGEVLSAKRHPEADKLSVCEVTTDGSDRLQIICGAANVRAGLKVAVAKQGAELPGGLKIKRAKLRGLESQGMLCSARELGIGTEHDGIMELAQALSLGADVRAALDLDDTVFEVKATPNRGDCMSTFGIARDYLAARERRYLEFRTPAVAARAGVLGRCASMRPTPVPCLPVAQSAVFARMRKHRCGCASACGASASTASRRSSMSPIT